ncbi:MAG: hypothetical protein ABIP48_21660, partial [Planctomycetota bacterium]
PESSADTTGLRDDEPDDCKPCLARIPIRRGIEIAISYYFVFRKGAQWKRTVERSSRQPESRGLRCSPLERLLQTVRFLPLQFAEGTTAVPLS